ncbi:MAG: TVP38/TMEM64 family protein [Candidatus Omnitrophica bacterium]|nr:TVP38/TMEM64 family protein [Candidatus Omnitrophota bacterium]
MKPARWKWVKFGGLVGGLAAVVVTLRILRVDWSDLTPEQVRSTIRSFGWWSPLVYVLAFAQPLIPLPGSIMAMAGGLLFGVAGGFVAAWVAAMVRGCGQFLLARIFGREAIETLLHGRLATWHERIGRNGFQAVFWIRVLPNVPFDIQNFGLGFSRVPFRTFTLATCLGLIPGLLVWVYLGHTLTDSAQLWKIGIALLGVTALWALQHHYRNRRVRVSS